MRFVSSSLVFYSMFWFNSHFMEKAINNLFQPMNMWRDTKNSEKWNAPWKRKIQSNPIIFFPSFFACVYLLFQLKLYFSLVKRLVFGIIMSRIYMLHGTTHCCTKMECVYMVLLVVVVPLLLFFVRNYSSQLQLNVFHLIGSVSIVINQVVLYILYCVCVYVHCAVLYVLSPPRSHIAFLAILSIHNKINKYPV